jgi:hypothetical protein
VYHPSRPFADLCPRNGTPTHHDGRQASSVVHPVEADGVQDVNTACATTELSSGGVLDAPEKSQVPAEGDVADDITYRMDSPKTFQKSRSYRKRQRLSRPESVIQSVHTPARNMYTNPAVGKANVSYEYPHRHRPGGLRSRAPRFSSGFNDESRLAESASLYTVLGRYLDHCTAPESDASCFAFTELEMSLLSYKGFSPHSVETWATCLLEPKSRKAVALFEVNEERPPFFVLLLFLRRQHLSASTFGVILRHIGTRVKWEPLGWTALKVLSVRLLRHARKHWPESIPWVSSLFCTEATALFTTERLRTASPRLLSDLTNFSNVFLLLLSLPATINPILAAEYQERAQFEVLQFMASRTPAITVTKLGFRSVSRNQLAHPKTTEEKEWAELKGPSWPPWKEDRTAMDEDKGYEFGSSRASRILHRMYEAGYRGHLWEEMTEVYAGWDVDFSPTIQTRTSVPQISSQFRNDKYLTGLLWAGRVRTTRTRREAWACFLAYELSGAPISQHVYLAMFEKLYHSTLKRSSREKSQPDLIQETRLDEDLRAAKDELLPGDMIEVIPDPTSSLHYVYLSEPVPSIKELFHRMCAHNIRPSNRLLAFLLESAPTFKTCIAILETAREDSDGGIGHLLSGHLGPESSIGAVPDYLFAAFIKCLCRFGDFSRTPRERPLLLSPGAHYRELRRNRGYLMEYAYALLSHHPPLYRPAWNAYMDKVVKSRLDAVENGGLFTTRDGDVTKYTIVWKAVESMQQLDLDVDDKVFSTVCTVTMYAAQAAARDTTASEDSRYVLNVGSPRLRSLFHNLVGANIASASSAYQSSNMIPPHIPNPATLHAYVRALGTLRDYEGLYSLSIWLTKNHAEVTTRSEAQHSGSKLLFKTLVALRAAVTGYLENGKDEEISPEQRDIVQLIVAQIQTVEPWGGWPTQEHVDMYVEGRLRGEMPTVGGR